MSAVIQSITPTVERDSMIDNYHSLGWKLCGIPPCTKGPTKTGWNRIESALKPDDVLPDGWGVGLLHSYSNTCAFDIDSWGETAAWFNERGINLEELLNSDDSVFIDSGNLGHAKAIYALPSFMALPTKKVIINGITAFEFRCGTADSLSVQDCLPPSVHPNGKPYRWAGKGTIDALPPLPDTLRAIWEELLTSDKATATKAANDCDLTTAKSAMFAIDPDCDRKTWIEVGMGWHAAGGEFEVWNEWSSTGRKYLAAEMRSQWKSFKNKPDGIGVGTLIHHALATGWQMPPPDMSGKFSAVPDVKYATTEPTVNLVCAASVKAEHVSWLWKGWLAKGKIHIAAGAPGTGKTTIALKLAAIVSCGGTFPDGASCEAGNVLIWSGEDAVEDTLVPRLMAAGANLSRVFFVNELQHGDERIPFDPSVHMPKLQAVAKQLGSASLLIVDSIADVIAGDSHKNSEVRRGLRPLADFGQQVECAIFGIAHFNKGSGGKDPLERVMGSAAFGAVARIVYGCAKIIENDILIRRVFCRAKSNIGPDGDGFEYDINMTIVDDGIEASKVDFGDPIVGTAKEILASPDEGGSNPDEKGKMSIATSFLVECLHHGPVMESIVKKTAEDEWGISTATLRRAKKKLGVLSRQVSPRVWEWSLIPAFPDVSPEHKQ